MGVGAGDEDVVDGSLSNIALFPGPMLMVSHMVVELFQLLFPRFVSMLQCSAREPRFYSLFLLCVELYHHLCSLF